MTSRLLRHAADPWIGFFTLLLAAWGVLFIASSGLADLYGAEALGPGMAWGESLMKALAHNDLVGDSAGGHHWHHGFIGSVGMWCLMSIAMMAPTAVPLLRSYQDLAETSQGKIQRTGFWALLSGYIMVWLLFSVVAGIAQHLLVMASLVSAAGVSSSTWITISLLGIAGVYQFSPLKQACLSRCRSPLAFFLSHWRPGIQGAMTMGLHHGVMCVGCCWALMALGFVGGTMNLIWMGAAMLLMILEKLPVGQKLTIPLGVVLLSSALVVALAELIKH